MKTQTRNLFVVGLLLFFTAIAAHASTITVPAGGNLQAAINTAQPGDIISVEAGAAFRGPFEWPAKPCTAEIVLQSSRVNELPNGRVGPQHAALMPKLIATHADQAFRTKSGAGCFKLDGIEVFPDSAATVMYDLVRLGGGRDEQTTLASVAHHIKIDRCYIHGNGVLSFQRGISLNSSDTIISRNYIASITGRQTDAQAIASWNTPGRNQILDNYLEATGENVMLGGSDPASSDFVPADNVIARNNLFKPMSWRKDDPSFVPLAANPAFSTNYWTIKNLLELKNAKRTVIEGNILQNNWANQGQSGICVLFTTRNQDGTAPYSVIEDTTFRHNSVFNCDGGALNFLGSDNEKPSLRSSKAAIVNNVFDKIKGTFLTINGFDDVAIEHNTHLQAGNTMMFYGLSKPDIAVSSRLIYRFNVTKETEYGIRDEDGTFTGKAALDRWAPGNVFTDNVMATPYTSNPPGNQYPPSLTIDANYRTPYAAGADIDQLLAAQSGAVVVTPTPTPTPSPVPSVSPSPTATPTPTPSPAPSPVGSPLTRAAYEAVFPAANSDTDRQRVTKDMANQGWVCQPNPGGKFLICHRLKL